MSENIKEEKVTRIASFLNMEKIMYPVNLPHSK